MQETWVPSLGREDPLEKGKATHPRILAWRIPWTEEPGGLQSTGPQRVGLDGATDASLSFQRVCSWRSALCVPLCAFRGHGGSLWEETGQVLGRWPPGRGAINPLLVI